MLALQSTVASRDWVSLGAERSGDGKSALLACEHLPEDKALALLRSGQVQEALRLLQELQEAQLHDAYLLHLVRRRWAGGLSNVLLCSPCCSWLQGAVHEKQKACGFTAVHHVFCQHLPRCTSHPLVLNAPLRLQADRALHKALREADEQLRKMQARASSHADTSQALSQAAASCCGRLPPEAAAETFLGTCAQLDVLRALRDRASAAEQLSATATRLVSPPQYLSCFSHLSLAFLPG